jgi:hypothetical protein
MTLPQTFGFCTLLVGLIVFAARLSVEADPIDVMSLVALSIATGYMVTML